MSRNPLSDLIAQACAWAVVLALGVIACSLCCCGCYGLSGVQVAEGFRDCTVRKVSHTGLLWKTWEVEAVGAQTAFAREGRPAPEVFGYTAADEKVAKRLQSLPPGKRVRLRYRKMFTTWVPRGESPYFVVGVEELP